MKLRFAFPKPSKPSGKALVAIAALVISPIAVGAAAAGGRSGTDSGQAASGGAPAARTAPEPAPDEVTRDAGVRAAAAAAMEQCRSARLVPAANGWGVPAPSVWESSSTRCNLMYGDDPQRGNEQFGDPDTAIRTLQRNLNYCYGSKLTVDGVYGSNTRAVVKQVQQRHKLAADGIYGPQTRSAMNWRLYHSAKRIWSSGCYSPL
ncbi:peptidoglycan-binding domain-containing protein [Kribbella sp. CA-253562]|uniref:peptidoglycan-binding domain-containing protein n=1 Tax=Kribbella sp. CA-253562 TaxID=3239942 RepID=UPI003D929E37